MATVFGTNASKCGTKRQSCSLKYAVKFKKKCWWNRKEYFVPFTLCWHLYTLHKWRSIICKHNARWHHVSRLKASVFCPSWKKTNIDKTHQLKPGIGTAILEVYICFLHEGQNTLAFNWDTWWHLALCVQMILLHWLVKMTFLSKFLLNVKKWMFSNICDLKSLA